MPPASPDTTSIVNQRHFTRLTDLIRRLDPGSIRCGGESDPETLRIEPTVVSDVQWDDEVMREEIFGPILPVIAYDDLDVAIARIKSREKPLALYIYARDRSVIDRVVTGTTSGSMGINVSVLQFFNRNLPFGGVGMSGFGKYRGRSGFESFSNRKSILDRSLRPEMSLLDPPYGTRHTMIQRMIR